MEQQLQKQQKWPLSRENDGLEVIDRLRAKGIEKEVGRRELFGEATMPTSYTSPNILTPGNLSK